MKKGICLVLCLAFLCFGHGWAQGKERAAFESGSWRYYLLENGGACLTGYTGNAKALTIPKDIDSHPVKALAADMFPKDLGIVSILLPAGVKTIAAGAFRYLTKLTAIGVVAANPVYASNQGVLFDKTQKLLHTYPRGREGVRYGIPRGIKAIGAQAFFSCQKLEGIFIPPSVLEIGAEAFSGCRKLIGIRLPEGIHHIGTKAFSGCAGLTYMEIPASVLTIGPGMFQRCENLMELWVDEKNPAFTAINGALVEKEAKLLHTFLQKKASTVIRIPGGIKAIGPLAFSDCYFMQEVILPAGVESIGEEAFAYCYNLTSATLTESVSFIGQNAFLDCNRLVVSVPENSAAHQYAVKNGLPFALGGK